jgi:hypothetical protein
MLGAMVKMCGSMITWNLKFVEPWMKYKLKFEFVKKNDHSSLSIAIYHRHSCVILIL